MNNLLQRLENIKSDVLINRTQLVEALNVDFFSQFGDQTMFSICEKASGQLAINKTYIDSRNAITFMETATRHDLIEFFKICEKYVKNYTFR